MTLQEMIQRRSAIKAECVSVLDRVEAEKRKMTEEEVSLLDNLESEARALSYRMSTDFAPAGTQAERLSPAAEFRSKVDEIMTGKSSAPIELRGAGPMMTSDVSAVTPTLLQDLINPLEKGLVLSKINAKMMYGVRGEPVWPFLASIEATLLGEGVEVADQKLDITTIKSQPRRMAVAIHLTRETVNQSALNLYNIVMQQQGLAVARTMNKWVLGATKLNAQASEGPFVKTSMLSGHALDYPATGPVFKDLVALETAVRGEGVEVGTANGAYVLGTKLAGELKSTPVEKGNTRMIYEGGMINGYPVIESNYFADDAIGFGAFDYLSLLNYGDMSIIVDPYTLAGKNVVRFILNGDFDVVVLRKEAFALSSKKTTP